MACIAQRKQATALQPHFSLLQAGADVVFIDALESAAEMEALCKVQGAYKVR